MAAVAVALAVAGGLGTYALNLATSEPQNTSEPAPQRKPVEAVDSKTAVNEPQAHDLSRPAPSPRVVISEIRPPPGSTCDRVLFDDPSIAVRHSVTPLNDTTFTSSQLEGLCGIAIKPVVATDRFLVKGDLVAASHPPTGGPDGATDYYLLASRLLASRQQNIVYQIQVSGETESGHPSTAVIHHAIIR
jgi:hypothetical protein